MICPNCNKQTSTDKRIQKINGKNFMISSCRSCYQRISEKETRFGQPTRIIFLLFAVPLFLFFIVFLMIITGEYTPLNSFIVLIIFSIIFITIYFAHIHKWNKGFKEDVQKNILKPDLDNHSKNINSKDPLMKTISEKAHKKIDNTEDSFPKKIQTISGIVATMAIFVLLMYPSLKKMVTEISSYKENTKIEIVTYRATTFYNKLSLYKELYKQYPSSLAETSIIPDISFLDNDSPQELEKKYFDRVLTVNDFEYISDGETFSLCYNSDFLNKCWEVK